MVRELPVAVIGGGPIGLVTAIGLAHYGVPVVVYEEDDRLSLDTKAGTILTRTLEVLHRYGALDDVLRAAVRVDEIGELDRATNTSTLSVRTGDLTEDTRYPFVINIPQHELEPLLRDALERKAPGALRMGHRLRTFTDHGDRVELTLDGPAGEVIQEAGYVLACDGGHSTVRRLLGITVEGKTLEDRYSLVDLKVDLDLANPRDYPYLAYFGDPQEWMVLVRQPHCWRFLFPLGPGRPEPTREEFAEKVARFIGETDSMEILGTNIYSVHHRVAETWNVGRVFLMGDAAHLITPMWALGLNTGILDASNLPWRLAWLFRGWADESVLAGYEQEQAPVAIKGSGALAEAARANMGRRAEGAPAMGEGNWGNAFTRALLGVKLDVDGDGEWSMVKSGDVPLPVTAGDRAPDLPVFGPDGQTYVHDLCANSFVALHFTDARRQPNIPGPTRPGLRHYVVSRWDAPHDSGLRDRALFDPSERLRRRLGVGEDVVVLLRPDAHIAAILPAGDPDAVVEKYRSIVGAAASVPVPAS
ncbi:FAD-binding monooxygenase [Georgenia yuyongxinii]|uniref:FAD-binding monooxygenase n=1 Tax=Georgenia yuyongxinii TaxID=2589797 RepID=A0A5B8C320_9MICO|nr:FAD-dependent monooxygenase [Georgenia yuyongxinii]QDC25109.1 FAD-binding monooxygenase [Georgenia yuyongxinii]